MSHAYALAVRKNLPREVPVNDRFHVIKLYNQMLTELRRELYHEATKFQRKVLKGIRWLLLKRMDNLDDRKGEPRKLLRALKLNEFQRMSSPRPSTIFASFIPRMQPSISC